MTQMTIAELQKLIKERQAMYDSMILKERKCATFEVAADESVEFLRPTFDMMENLKQLEGLRNQITKLKHALNVFNASNTVPKLHITVDELLARLPMLKAEVERLSDYKNRLPRERSTCSNRYMTTKNPDYTIINYDLDEIMVEYQTKFALLTKYQLELDNINNTSVVELPDDLC